MVVVRHRGGGGVGVRGGARRRASGRRARGAGPRGRGGEARAGGVRRAKGPAVLASHVFGLGIDEVLTSTRDLDPTPADGTPDSQVWLHQDDMGTVYAATGAGGIVVERYDYGDYGLPTILDPDGVTVRDESTIGNRFAFTGREWLATLGLYDYRHRMMDPRTGRFTERDPLGYVDSMSLYVYSICAPTVYVDPIGLAITMPCDLGTDMDKMQEHDYWSLKRICETDPERCVRATENYLEKYYGRPTCLTSATDTANREAENRYPKDGLPQTERRRNAMRHCIRACELAKCWGSSPTEETLDARETILHWLLKNRDSSADVHNNTVGISLAGSGDCAGACQAALDAGSLDTRHPKAVPSW